MPGLFARFRGGALSSELCDDPFDSKKYSYRFLEACAGDSLKIDRVLIEVEPFVLWDRFEQQTNADLSLLMVGW